MRKDDARSVPRPGGNVGIRTYPPQQSGDQEEPGGSWRTRIRDPRPPGNSRWPKNRTLSTSKNFVVDDQKEKTGCGATLSLHNAPMHYRSVGTDQTGHPAPPRGCTQLR